MKRGYVHAELRGKLVHYHIYIYITLWYVHVPRFVHIPKTDQNRPRYMHQAIAIVWYVLIPKSVQRYVHIPWSVQTIAIAIVAQTMVYSNGLFGMCTYLR